MQVSRNNLSLSGEADSGGIQKFHSRENQRELNSKLSVLNYFHFKISTRFSLSLSHRAEYASSSNLRIRGRLAAGTARTATLSRFFNKSSPHHHHPHKQIHSKHNTQNQQNMAPPSQLAIATSSVQRLVKEEASYEKELVQQRARVEKLVASTEDDGNREYQLKQEVSPHYYLSSYTLWRGDEVLAL